MILSGYTDDRLLGLELTMKTNRILLHKGVTQINTDKTVQ